MNQPADARLYTGAIDCFVKLIKKDGVKGLYAGTISYCALLYLVSPCLTLPHPTLLYLTSPYPALPYLTLPCLALAYVALPLPMLP